MAVDDFKGDSLRQRLVGGVALLAIGVIAWFWLLSADSPVDPVSRTTQIPTAPDIQPFSVPEPTPPGDIAPINSTNDSQPVPEKTQTAQAKTVKPKETFELDQQGLPVAWVVQVGLFSNQAAADKVKTTLQKKGLKAYSELYKTDGVPKGVKVFVGPKLSRERADEQKRLIDAALKVDSKIVRFQSPQR